MLCIRGKFVGLELKSKEGSPSKLQEYKCAQIEKAGGLYYVVYPHNWLEIKAVLETLAR
jgi:hypothetical protein